MKTAYLYFSYATFQWDCWKCGHFHIVNFEHETIQQEKLTLKCPRCGEEYKSKITFDYLYPDDPNRRKKLKQKDKKWYTKHFGNYLKKSLKKKRKSK